MKKNIVQNFISQIDQIIEARKESLATEQQNLISKSAAAGLVQSGGFIKQSLDLANANIILVVDDSLKFALNYAIHENLAATDFINSAAEKFQAHKNLIWENLERHHLIKSWIAREGIKKIFEEEKVKLNNTISNLK